MISIPEKISIVAVLVNITLVLIAYVQLRGLRKGNSFKIIIDLSQQVGERKAALDSLFIQFRVLAESDKLIPYERLRLELETAVAIEDYINSLEQLAFIILKKYLPEHQAKDQYQKLIRDIAEDYPERFEPESPYSSLKKLYKKWEKSNTA